MVVAPNRRELRHVTRLDINLKHQLGRSQRTILL